MTSAEGYTALPSSDTSLNQPAHSVVTVPGADSPSQLSVGASPLLQGRATPTSVHDDGSSPSPSISRGGTKRGSTTPSRDRRAWNPSRTTLLGSKMRYYSALRSQAQASPRIPGQASSTPRPRTDSFLAPPESVIPPQLFGLPTVDDNKYQSSWQTITTMVNTMIGTTIVALPYLFARSGIAMGLAILGFIGFVSCFTCILVVSHGKGFEEFSQFVDFWLGGRWRAVSWAMSNLVILGACIIYHILMQESLYQVVQSIVEAAGGTGEGWSRPLAAVAPLVVLPLASLRDMSLLVKLSSGGFFFVTYTIVFISYHGVHSWISDKVLFVPTLGMEGPGELPDGRLQIAWGIREGAGALGGAAMLSFFIHNIIQPITKQADPATKHRDIRTAFVVAATCYMVIGTLGYIGFGDRKAGAQLAGNFLEMFGTNLHNREDLYAFTARLSLFCQLMTVFPVLMFIIRTQVYGFLLGAPFPSLWKVVALNILIVAVTYTFAALNVNVAVVTRFSGAICGIVLIFVVPIIIDRLAQTKAGTLTPLRSVLHGGVLLVGLLFLVVQFVPQLT